MSLADTYRHYWEHPVYPKTNCDSRAPLCLPQPRGGLHALPTQQPYDLPAKERAPMTFSASGGHLYARIINTYIFNPTHGPCRLLSRRLSAAYELVLLHWCSTSWVGRISCVSVDGAVGLWVGEWESGFGAMCGSRVLQFCFLDPLCFRTAVVVQGGWVDRFVGYVFFFLFFLQL